MPTTLLLLAYLNAAILISGFALFIYRVYFHPLAKIPGPLSNKLSAWSHFFAAQSGRRHIWLHELHEKYGPVVRLTPNTVSSITPTALKDIYGNRKAFKKSVFYEAVMKAEGGTSTFTARDEAVHDVKRRLLSHAFSERAVQDYEQYVSRNIDKWLDALGAGPLSRAGWTEEKNASTWISYLTFDVLTDLAYGRSFDLLGKNDMRFAAELGPKASMGLYQVGLHPLTRIVSWIMYKTPIGILLAWSVVRSMMRLTSTSKQFFEERRSMETSSTGSGSTDVSPRKDFFHYLLRSKDSETGTKHTTAELAAESNLLLIAGADTTATTLAACVFYLVRHPRILQTLRQELENHFTTLDEINYAGTSLGTLPYLRAILDETLRLNPPVGGHIPREVLAPGVSIDDIFYPPGTTVGVSTYAMHHSALSHPDPYTFTPERWIANPDTGRTKESVAREYAAFAPFSIGHRGCIGKHLAYIEMSLAIARCVWRFEMEEVKGWDGMLGGGWVSDSGKGKWEGEGEGKYVTRDGFVSLNEGPLVRFRERKGKGKS